MALEIPLFNNPFYTFQIKIDIFILNLEFAWSTREESWYFSIFDAENQPIVLNIKLMPFTDLTLKHPNSGLPAGVFYCVSLTSDSSPPGRNDLGDRIRLYHITAADLANGSIP